MASVARAGEDAEAAETQQHSFTEDEVSQMHEKVRELAPQTYTDKEELESWLGRLDSELQGISGLQERGSRLQEALKQLLEEVEDLRARNVEPAAEQVEALTLLRGASEALRERWPEDKPPNKWEGVTFKEGQVSALSLKGCKKLKSLPAEVGGLLALTSLNLGGTALTTLPAVVGGLRALTSLKLAHCDKLTTLPAVVGGLRALTLLDLRGTHLKTLPAEVGGLLALTSLNLSETGLESLPAEVGGLRALTSLYLSHTALTTLPAVVGGLRALTSLDLSYTPLTTLPFEVGGLRALTSLYLAYCDALTSPPKERHNDAVAAKDWLHGQHLVAQHSAKRWDGDEMLRCLRDRPGVLHALAEQPAAADLLRAVFEADPTLADVTEGEKLGRTPIQHACPACNVAMRAALCLLGRFEIDDGPPLHFSATSAVVQADDLGGAGETSGADAKPPRCALKAMRKTEQVLAELNGRNGLDRRYVVAVLAVYVDESADKEELQQIVAAAERLGVPVESALNLERRLSLELAQRIQNVENVEKADGSGAGIALQRRPSTSMEVITTPATAAQEPQAARAAGYRFVIALALADRNLNTALTHDNVAGNDFPQIRMIMSHLAHALDNLHSEERIHADFKPLNAARELTWKLIDMDVSRKFDESFGTKLPSSGYCPPEVAKVLLAVHNAETEEAKTQELAKHTASVAYDLWSFGVVLFHLCYGISLFNTDQNDNVKMDDLQTLAEAPGGPWRKLINKALRSGEVRNASVDIKAAAVLLRKLLEPDPSKRLQYFPEGGEMMRVLEEPFFQGQSVEEAAMHTQLDRMEQKADAAFFQLITMGEEHRSELRRTREVLLKAVFEATEVQTPTAFIILEEKLPDDEEEEEELMLKLELKEDGTGFEASGELAELAETVKGRFDTGMKWVERIKTFSEGVVAADPIKTFAAMKATFKELVTDETMYLYLIDELTGKPVKGGIYPIEITTPSEIVPQLLSVMQVGMRAMSLYNGAAGIARMCGAPVPTMPTGWCKGAQESIALLGQRSSVEKFGVVHDEVMSEDATEREAKTVRGASLRELQRFFKDKDVGNTFAGLRRLGDDDGTAVWTVLTDEKEVRAAIEARAKERLAEQVAQEEFVHALLLFKLERTEPIGEASSVLQAAGAPSVGESSRTANPLPTTHDRASQGEAVQEKTGCACIIS